MGTHKFYYIGSHNNGSNLTELNATDSVAGGFMNHSDWLAHVMRYAAAMQYIQKNDIHEVLDVGCGKMQLLIYLWRNRFSLEGFTYTGLDLRARQEWLTDHLPTAANINLVQMNIVEDQVNINPKQMVVCTEVLEHIDKALAPTLLQRLHAWTAKEGTLFLSSPNLGGSDSVAANHTAPDGTPREWTYAGKKALIESAGFKIIDSMGTFIKLDAIPEGFWNEYTREIKNKLPNSFFRVFAASVFPKYANNALFICKPV